jgi:hypothetical protein
MIYSRNLEWEGKHPSLTSQSRWLSGACDDVTTNETHTQEQQHHLLLPRDVGWEWLGEGEAGGGLVAKIAVAVRVIYLGGVEPSQCLSQSFRISCGVETHACVQYVRRVPTRTWWNMEVLCVECSRRSSSRVDEGQRNRTSLLVSF